MQPQITAKSWAMVLTLGVVWGATFMVIELALEGITPFWLAAARITFAAALTSVIWLYLGGKLFDTANPRDWVNLSLVGVLSTAIPFMAISWGQQFVTAGFAGVAMASVALLVLPLAHFLIPNENLTVRKTFGFVIGFIGVCVLIGPSALSSTGLAGETAGRLACLFAASCYAVSSVAMRRLPPIDPVGLSAVTLVIGAALVIAAAWIVEGPPPMPSTRTLMFLALLGLVPTAGANLLRVLLIRSAGPTFMSLVNYMVPLWAVTLGVMFLGETVEPTLFIAIALILLGVGLSQWGALKRLFSRRRNLN